MYPWKLLNCWLLLIVIVFIREIGSFQSRLCKKDDAQNLPLRRESIQGLKNFELWFEEASLKSFICDFPREIFPYLVRRLYSNLKYDGEILTSEVKKHKIKLSHQEFVEICNLQCSEYEVKGNNYSYFPNLIYFYIILVMAFLPLLM